LKSLIKEAFAISPMIYVTIATQKGRVFSVSEYHRKKTELGEKEGVY
jgi:hypothetical protein